MQYANPQIESLSQLITKAHSPYHCCAYCMEVLKKNGFEELSLSNPWKLSPGGKYFINVYGSTCIAFTLGFSVGKPSSNSNAAPLQNADFLSEIPAFRMITSHTDWPAFLIKPQPEISSGNYGKLNVEPYGGSIYTSWLDRPLGIAGKVCTKSTDPFKPQVHMVDSGKPVAIIPSLAIHMDHEVNNGVKLNPQLHMLPLVTLRETEAEKDFFLSYLADLAHVEKEDILDYELFLYNDDSSDVCGINGEFFSSPRIDNCSSVQAALNAICHSDPDSNLICMSAFYHNEEIGSTTKQGADSGLTFGILERIFDNLGFDREAMRCAMAQGLCLSLDVAHGMHPNHPDKNDVTNHVCLGSGVTLKLSSRQSYATDASYVSIMQGLCEKYDIPYAKYVNRSDIKGGMTLGSISSAMLNIPCVDAGVSLLSMHSARELMACADQTALCRLAEVFFQN